MYGFVYITTNNVNGKKYIGQKKYGVNGWETYLGSGVALNNAIKKYGKENFTREIIDEANSSEELNKKEIYWIKYYNAIKSNVFYNIASGGDGGNTTLGYSTKEKQELSQKRSEAFKGINLGSSNSSAKPVICLNTMQVFDCAADADRYYGFKPDTVSNVCNPNSRAKTTKNPNGEERLIWEYYYVDKQYVYKPFTPDNSKKKRRKVYCFEYKKVYNSITECAKALGVAPNSLNWALNHPTHKYKNIHIVYYDEYFVNSNRDNKKAKSVTNNVNTYKKKVKRLNDGVIFESIKEAERKTGISHTCISRCCSGKYQTAGGYRWCYI